MKTRLGFKKLLIYSLTLIFLIVFFTGCGSAPKDSVPRESTVDSSEYYPYEEDGIFFDEETDSKDFQPGKIITTVNINFETLDFEKTRTDLEGLIGRHKGYVENSNISHGAYYNNRSYRRGYFTIRIPQEFLNEFKSDLVGIGNILSESTSKEDVTKGYRDLEARINILNVKEERLLALLERADKMEDIILLENQLTEVIYERERLSSNLLSLDDKITFSTVYVELIEVDKFTGVETRETGFLERLVFAFSDSIYSFVKLLENLVIALVYFLPVALLLVLAAFFIYKFIYNRIKK